jgi:hypothetical protein
MLLCVHVPENGDDALDVVVPLLLVVSLEFVGAVLNFSEEDVDSAIDVALGGLRVGPQNVWRLHFFLLDEEVPRDRRPHERIQEIPSLVVDLEVGFFGGVEYFVNFLSVLLVLGDFHLNVLLGHALESHQQNSVLHILLHVIIDVEQHVRRLLPPGFRLGVVVLLPNPVSAPSLKILLSSSLGLLKSCLLFCFLFLPFLLFFLLLGGKSK